MIRIALVDDDDQYLSAMKKYLSRYTKEQQVMFSVSEFHDGLNFVEDYDAQQDIIFMDIEMPLLDGMSAARKIREKDSRVGIVFITNMAQYAIKGYEVNAIDFIVKPIDYYSFSDRLTRAIRTVSLNTQKDLLVHTAGGDLVRLDISRVLYVEKSANYLIYHAGSGNYSARGSLAKIEKDLIQDGFSYSSKGLLVNLRFVNKVEKDLVTVGKEQVPLSRRRRREFVEDLMRFLGGTFE